MTTSHSLLVVAVSLLGGCQQIFGLEAPARGRADASGDTMMTTGDVPTDQALDDTPGEPGFTCASSVALRACYRFEGGVTDESGNGYNGVTSGVSFVAGYDGMALATSSGSSVTVAGGTGLDITTVTIRAWINPTTLPSSGARMGILDSANRYRAFLMAGGALRCSVTVGGAVEVTSAVGLIATNTWTRVACTYDGTTLKGYVNGTLVATLTQSGTISATAGGMVIGQNNPAGENFDGKIDNLEIWGALVAP